MSVTENQSTPSVQSPPNPVPPSSPPVVQQSSTPGPQQQSTPPNPAEWQPRGYPPIPPTWDDRDSEWWPRHHHRRHRKDYDERKLLDLVGHSFTPDERAALADAREAYRKWFVPSVVGGVVAGLVLSRPLRWRFFGRLLVLGGSIYGGYSIGRSMGQTAGQNVLLEQLPADSPLRKVSREIAEFQFTRGCMTPRPQYTRYNEGSYYPPPIATTSQTSPQQQQASSPPLPPPSGYPTSYPTFPRPSEINLAGVAAEEVRDRVAKMLSDLSVTVSEIGREHSRRGGR